MHFGVNIFAMISGYVGANARHKFSSFVKVYAMVWFYSVGIWVLYLLCTDSFSSAWGEIVKALFPVVTKAYWYFTAYTVLWFIMPLLNHGIECVEIYPDFQRGLLLFLLIVTIIPIVSPNADCKYTLGIFDGHNLIWLAICYCIGAYSHRYGLCKNWSNMQIIIACCLSILFTPAWLVISSLFFQSRCISVFTEYSSLPMMLSALFLLLAFERLHIDIGNQFIRFVTPSLFSVYLIHDHPAIHEWLRGRLSFIWTIPFYLLPLCIFLVVVSLFISCIIIDLVRRAIVVKVQSVRQPTMACGFETK